MTIEEKRAELAKVDAAIDKVLSSGLQSYAISSGGGSRTGANLPLGDLYKRKAQLENDIAALSGALGQRLGAAW
jgi:hypothetical protein